MGVPKSARHDPSNAEPSRNRVDSIPRGALGKPGQASEVIRRMPFEPRSPCRDANVRFDPLAERYDLNPKRVMKWRKRAFVDDAPMGPGNFVTAVGISVNPMVCKRTETTRRSGGGSGTAKSANNFT
jgi:hypothetical protein